MDWQSWIRKYWWQGIMITVGIGLVVRGIGMNWGTGLMGEEVEVIDEAEETIHPGGNSSKLVVDIEGAVVKPGVYQLHEAARMGEAIEMAGGLSGEADKDWVAKNLNLAEVIKDGSKVYVPMVNNAVSQPDTIGRSIAGNQELININTATATDLDKLWGIGAARAQTIIDNRPYGSISELAVKAGIPNDVIERNKDKLTVY